jgi:hypothetical protein
MGGVSFDANEFAIRLTKYVLQGIVVAVACLAIPCNKMGLDEALLIALLAAGTFALLDFYAPSVET